jgi:hypothetical protein
MATCARGAEFTKPNAGDAKLSANCSPWSTNRSSVRIPFEDADIFDFEIHFARLVYTKAIFIGKSGLVCEKVAGRPAATSPNSPARTGWPRPSRVKSLRFSSKASPVG